MPKTMKSITKTYRTSYDTKTDILSSQLKVFKTDSLTSYSPDLIIELDLTQLKNGVTIM